MSNVIEKLFKQGQSVWCDSLSRSMINTGELQRLVNLGVVGVTSNPTIFMKAITEDNDYDDLLGRLLGEGQKMLSVYEGLVIPDIIDTADILRPVYDQTNGIDGYVSLEVNPKLAYDTQATVTEARRLFDMINRPNVFIKVPATEEGLPAIETLIGQGINVNVTLIFSLDMYENVMRAYIDGLKRFESTGGDLSRVASVASFFVSRIDTLVDKRLDELQSTGQKVDHLLGRAAIANAKLAYERFAQTLLNNDEFKEISAIGARLQRPLWASTSTKNPNYPDTMYTDGLVGPHTVNTLPPKTIEVVLDHGCAEVTLGSDYDSARKTIAEIEGLGIKMKEVTDQLTREGVDLFAQSFEELLANLSQKTEQVRAAG